MVLRGRAGVGFGSDESDKSMGVSESRGPQYGTLKSRILIIRTPK